MPLPPIGKMIVKRPGKSGSSFIPSPAKNEFWNSFYPLLFKDLRPEYPTASKPDPYFGRFGFRFNPKHSKRRYFHGGSDFAGAKNENVRAIADGILEYSGFGVTNGQYVFLSHPQIKTEDGFVLYSLYMHLSEIKIFFSAYQKMLREISFNTYPEVLARKGEILGVTGVSGNTHQMFPHMHLQIEFKSKKKNGVVLLDPMRVLGGKDEENLTAGLTTPSEFKKFRREREKEITADGFKEFFD